MEGWLFIGTVVALMYVWGWWKDIRKKLKQYDILKPRLDKLDEYQSELIEKERRINSDLVQREQKISFDKEAINNIVKEKARGFPWLAAVFADYFALQDGKIAHHLESKKHPAMKSAEHVREISRLRKDAEKRAKIYKYLVDTYENMFPWLVEFREYSDEEIQELLAVKSRHDTDAELTESEYLAKNRLLSPQEYQKLSSIEKFQLALDRYWKKEKNTWEIGRDYERYVGFWYESKGYDVEYTGIREGLADLGRDIIAKKKNEIKIIQCKCWAADKTIHEKHIFQLFGTTVEYRIKNFPNEDLFNPQSSDLFGAHIVQPVFVTSTSLSDKAREFAKILKVEVKEKFRLDTSYPCIKCNIAPHGGEKIYHLPFDQQYDTAKIIVGTKECYAATIQEAENKGFRRAFRWRGESD